MTVKRFTFHHDVDGVDYIEDESNGVCLICDELMCSLLNELHEENDVFRQKLKTKAVVDRQYEELQILKEKNEHLKQDNNALIHLLENQSMIIEELHSKLLEYQVKEPIVLTKEDLNLMGKAISYYTHGRYAE